MPHYMCEYGNCDSYETPIVVTFAGDPGERKRFCCNEHAGLYLLFRGPVYGRRDRANADVVEWLMITAGDLKARLAENVDAVPDAYQAVAMLQRAAKVILDVRD